MISGPSGAGKTSLLEGLLKSRKLKNRLAKSVSLTTRPKRQGERQGKDYFFVSKAAFLSKRKAKKILEWTKYLGYYYATPKGYCEQQLQKNKAVVLCIDVKGAAQIKKLYPQQCVSIFVLPPSVDDLRARISLRRRETDSQEIEQRIAIAKKELQLAKKYDYRVVNRSLAQALKKLGQIILQELNNN